MQHPLDVETNVQHVDVVVDSLISSLIKCLDLYNVWHGSENIEWRQEIDFYVR